MTEKIVKLEAAEQGSRMQTEFQRDAKLADKYLQEARAQDLYELYQRRCTQLNEFGKTLATMAELYAGEGRGKYSESPDAVKAMERVALSAIELAKAFVAKAYK